MLGESDSASYDINSYYDNNNDFHSLPAGTQCLLCSSDSVNKGIR